MMVVIGLELVEKSVPAKGQRPDDPGILEGFYGAIDGDGVDRRILPGEPFHEIFDGKGLGRLAKDGKDEKANGSRLETSLLKGVGIAGVHRLMLY